MPAPRLACMRLEISCQVWLRNVPDAERITGEQTGTCLHQQQKDLPLRGGLLLQSKKTAREVGKFDDMAQPKKGNQHGN